MKRKFGQILVIGLSLLFSFGVEKESTTRQKENKEVWTVLHILNSLPTRHLRQTAPELTCTSYPLTQIHRFFTILLHFHGNMFS